MKRNALRAIMILCIAVLITCGVQTWRQLTGRRSISSRIAERTTYDGPTTAPVTAAEDWPAWRGPRGDGISRETAAVARWPAGGPRALWSADVGLGYSSPVAAAGRVYLFSLNNGQETLTAFDAGSGHILWSQEGGAGWVSSYPGTRSTPAIEGNSIYTYGGAGDLICRDAQTGRSRWEMNVLRAAGARNLAYGVASSPLVARGLVFVQGGTGGPIAVAIDKESGQVAWRAAFRGTGGYAPCVLADVAGTPQLIVFGGDTLVGMDARDGKTIWSESWRTSYHVNSSTPVYDGAGHLFITSSYGQGCMTLRLTPQGATREWAGQQVSSKIQSAILDGAALYANSEGTLKCLSWPDGATKWQADASQVDLGSNGSLLRAGDRLILMSDIGKLSLVQATPQAVTPLGSAQVIGGSEIFAVPLLYGGRIYVKGPKELICFDLSSGSH